MKKLTDFLEWIEEKRTKIALKIIEIDAILWRERRFINVVLVVAFVLFLTQSFLSNSTTSKIVEGKDNKVLVNQKKGTTLNNMAPVSRKQASKLMIVDSLFLDRPALAE